MTCACSPWKREIQSSTWMFVRSSRLPSSTEPPSEAAGVLTSPFVQLAKAQKPQLRRFPVGTLIYEAIRRKRTPKASHETLLPQQISVNTCGQGPSRTTHTLTHSHSHAVQKYKFPEPAWLFLPQGFHPSVKNCFPHPTLFYLLQSCPLSKPYLQHHSPKQNLP